MTEKKKKNPRGRPRGFKPSDKTKRKTAKTRTTHGVYTLVEAFKKGHDPIDGRTAAGKIINTARDNILAECGPEPSQKQITVCDMIRTKLGVLDLAGKAIVGTEPEQLFEKKELMRLWLQYSESLARDMERLPKLAKGQSGPLDYERYVENLRGAKNE